ncbi:MAG: TolC family protein [Sandaracinaceae bacterium]
MPPSAPPSLSRALLVGALALSSVLTGPAAAQSLAAEEVVARALGASPTIRAAQADLDSAAAGVRAADGARVPTLTLNGEGRHTESLNVAANGVASSQQNQLSAGAAATIQTDLGTSITVGLSTSVRWFSTNLDPTRTDLFTIGPIYTGALTLDARQPLLRGAGTDATLGPRREADARRLAADRSLAETTSALARDALLAHWELWYAQEALRIADDALGLATRQHEEASLREDALGTVAATEVLRYAAELARARRNRAIASAEVESRAVALGQLIGVTGPSALELRADAGPPEAQEVGALGPLAAAAREGSSQLLSLEAEVRAAETRLAMAGNADQPRVDLVASLASTVVFDDDSLASLQLPGNRPALSGILGVEVELPLGSSQQSAERDQARAALDGAQARYDEAARAVEAEAATLRTTLVGATARIALSAEAAEVADRLAEAERARLELGTGTTLEVLQAQQSAREASLELRRAQADRAEAALRLAHLVGALVDPRTAALRMGAGS